MSEAEIVDMLRVNREIVEKGFQEFRNDVASFRDDMRVQFAIIQRVDATMVHLLEEIRAMHAQYMRLAGRVQKLEDAP